jgi:hypothetical protein
MPKRGKTLFAKKYQHEVWVRCQLPDGIEHAFPIWVSEQSWRRYKNKLYKDGGQSMRNEIMLVAWIIEGIGDRLVRNEKNENTTRLPRRYRGDIRDTQENVVALRQRDLPAKRERNIS